MRGETGAPRHPRATPDFALPKYPE